MLLFFLLLLLFKFFLHTHRVNNACTKVFTVLFIHLHSTLYILHVAIVKAGIHSFFCLYTLRGH